MCPRKAVGYLKTALQLEKVMGVENPETRLILALTLLDMVKVDEASEYIALIEEKNDVFIDDMHKVSLLQAKGRLFRLRGETQKALVIFNDLVRAMESGEFTMRGMAEILYERGLAIW